MEFLTYGLQTMYALYRLHCMIMHGHQLYYTRMI